MFLYLGVNLLGIVEDGGGGGSRGGVMHDRLQQGLVQLGLVEAAEDKEDVGADAGEAALAAEEAGEAVHEAVAGQELADAEEVENEAQDAVQAGNPGDGALHVADGGHGGQEMRQPHFGRNVQPCFINDFVRREK